MINLGGKEFPFEKYTMRHGAYVEDLCGYGVSQLIEEMQKTPLRSMIKLIYTGIEAGCSAQKMPCKWTIEEITELCFDEGIEKLSAFLSVEEAKKKEAVST